MNFQQWCFQRLLNNIANKLTKDIKTHMYQRRVLRDMQNIHTCKNVGRFNLWHNNRRELKLLIIVLVCRENELMHLTLQGS